MQIKIFWASLVACAAAVTSATLWAFLLHGLNQWGALFSVLMGCLLGVVAFWTCQRQGTHPPSKLEGLLLGIFAIASFRCFFWLLYPVQDSLCILSPYNLGDLSLHIQLIRYFALGTPFWPESPILSGIPLIYPAGVDLLNSILLLLGVPLLQGLVWVGIIGAALTAFALWQWGRGFGIAAFLFAGGASGFTYLMKGNLDLFQENVDWKNLFLAMFVTQRGLLYALPAGLGLLHVWRKEFGKPDEERRPPAEKVPLWLQAVIYTTLPLFNVHAFLFLTLVLVSYFLFSGHPGTRKCSLALLLIGIPPAAIEIYTASGGFSGGAAFSFLPGWLQGEHPWQFWWNNFGILPLLWLILIFLPSVYRDPSARCILFAASLAFICCCFFSLSPWAWDNTKFMIWGYLAIAPLLWKFLLRPLPCSLRTTLCVVLFFSGAIALLGGLRSPGHTLISLAELRNVEASLDSLPPLSRFATSTDYNHPVALCGRKRVAGYEGHLWSHGLPYQPVLDKLNRLMNGESDWQSLARELKVDFIFWGPREESRYPHSKKPWLTQGRLVSQSSFGIICDLRFIGDGKVESP